MQLFFFIQTRTAQDGGMRSCFVVDVIVVVVVVIVVDSQPEKVCCPSTDQETLRLSVCREWKFEFYLPSQRVSLSFVRSPGS